MQTAIIIPARLQATRLPNKPLADLAGVPMVVRVAQQARQCALAHRVVIATDAVEIVEAARLHQIDTIMTASTHPSGTDRVYEAAQTLAADFVINVQGDEPFIEPDDLCDVIDALHASPAEVVTLRRPCKDAHEFASPDAVKVVCDGRGRALYFSRAPIPFGGGNGAPAFIHIGVYGMRRDTLATLHHAPPAALERSERLEQLRALDLGLSIHVLPAKSRLGGIDTAQDLRAARQLLAQAQEPPGVFA